MKKQEEQAAKSCIAGFIHTEPAALCSWDLFLVCFLWELQVPEASESPLRHMGGDFSLRLLLLQAWANLGVKEKRNLRIPPSLSFPSLPGTAACAASAEVGHLLS